MPDANEAQVGTLGPEGLARYRALEADAVRAVSDRLQETHGALYAPFGERGRAACRQDLAFHLEFLRPVLEFGLLSPMVEYLRWMEGVLSRRGIPTGQVALSLDLLGAFFAERMPGAEGETVRLALQAARTHFSEAGRLPANDPVSPPAWPEAAAFETALIEGRRHDAIAVVDACLEGGKGLVDIELHVIQPALYAIGVKWQHNEISVAQEHLATAITHAAMTAGLLRSVPPPPIGKRVLLACVEGNTHSVGLQMVADAFVLSGWDVDYLGANMPSRSLVEHVAATMPDLVGLSVSFSHQLGTARDIIARLKERLGDRRPPVIVGGLAINRFEKLAGVLGADSWSPTSRDAPVHAARLLAS